MLSEAVSRLTKEFKEKHTEVEWHLITGFRNIIVHEYFRVNWYIVWDIIAHELPVFKDKIENILFEL